MADKPEEKKEEPKEEVKLTKQEMQNISNLLYVGKFGLSYEETEKIVKPIINKLAQMADLAK